MFREARVCLRRWALFPLRLGYTSADLLLVNTTVDSEIIRLWLPPTPSMQAFWTMYETKLAKVQPDTVPACPADAPILRRLLFRAASSPRWNVALAGLVGANVVARFLIGSDWMHYRDAPAWIHLQEAIFAAILVLEWVCRAVAFGGVRAITRWEDRGVAEEADVLFS